MNKKIITTSLCYMDHKTSKKTRRLTAEILMALASSEYTRNLMLQIEAETDEEKQQELKNQLFVALFMCQYRSERPTLATAEPSGLCMHDFDKMTVNVRDFYAEHISGHEEEWGIILAHVTPRGKGLRLVTEMLPGETVPECQNRWAQKLGMSESKDPSVKDITRLSFIPSAEYFLYINKEAFEKEREVSIADPKKAAVEALPPVYSTSSAVAEQTAPMVNVAAMFDYQGITFDVIITEVLNRLATDGKPREGERNADLYALVRELRHITNYQFNTIYTLVKYYFSDLPDSEVRRTINSALNSSGRTLTPTMRGVIAQLQAEKMPCGHEELMAWPKLPELPPVLKMLVGHYPKDLAPHVVLALLPILGVYGTHIRFRYLDNRRNSLSFMVAVAGKSASGKSFASHLFDMTTKPLAEWDARERKKDAEYQMKMDRRKQDEEYPEDPKAKIRLYADDITTSQLLEYQDNLGNEHGLQFTEEVSRLAKARKSRYADNDDLYCKSFDNAIGGKESKNRQTHNIRTAIHINTLFCGTKKSMHEFYNNPEGGLNNRVIFASLPDKLSRKYPRYEDLTPEEEEMLNNIIALLWQAGTEELENGQQVKAGDPVHFGREYQFPFLDKAIDRWIDKCNKEDMENPDETWRRLANRAAVMGYRAGALVWFLWGCPTDEKTLRKVQRFAVWVAEVARISIYNFCGDEYDRLNEEETKYTKTRQTKNKKLLSLLPDEFSTQDIVALRLQNGDSANVNMVVSRWIDDGLVMKLAPGKFRKAKRISA